MLPEELHDGLEPFSLDDSRLQISDGPAAVLRLEREESASGQTGALRRPSLELPGVLVSPQQTAQDVLAPDGGLAGHEIPPTGVARPNARLRARIGLAGAVDADAAGVGMRGHPAQKRRQPVLVDRFGQEIVLLQVENERFGNGVEGLLEAPAPGRRLRLGPAVGFADAKGSDRDVRRRERLPFRVQIDGVRDAADPEFTPKGEKGGPAVLELVAGIDENREPRRFGGGGRRGVHAMSFWMATVRAIASARP